MKIDNKGFTLVEVLAVVVIIALLTSITVPSVINSINASKESAYSIMVSNIVTASIELYEEVNEGIEVYSYDEEEGSIDYYTSVTIEEGVVVINLHTLVSNGYLTGTNVEDSDGIKKSIINPKTNVDIGSCKIEISKEVDGNNKVSYTIKSISTSDSCPTDEEYEEVTTDKYGEE